MDAGGAAQDAEVVDAEEGETGSGNEAGGKGTTHPDAATAGPGEAATENNGGGCNVGRTGEPHARTAPSLAIGALVALFVLAGARRRKTAG